MKWLLLPVIWLAINPFFTVMCGLFLIGMIALWRPREDR